MRLSKMKKALWLHYSFIAFMCMMWFLAIFLLVTHHDYVLNAVLRLVLGG